MRRARRYKNTEWRARFRFARPTRAEEAATNTDLILRRRRSRRLEGLMV